MVAVGLRFVYSYRACWLTDTGLILGRRWGIRPGRRSSSYSSRRPRAVVDLANELPVSRPAVSQHLRVLKNAGLVADEPAGTRRIYRVNPDGLAVLRADLDRFWGSALAAYGAAVEQSTEEDTSAHGDGG